MPIFASEKKGLSFYLPWLANILFSILSTTLFLNQVARHPNIHLTSSILHCIAMIAIFHLITHLLQILFDIVSSQTQTVTNVTVCIRNINNNNTLYSTILFCLLLGLSYPLSQPNCLHTALEVYLTGRIIFAIGYLIGTVVNIQSFRSYGFGMTVASLVAVVLMVRFNDDFIAKFDF